MAKKRIIKGLIWGILCWGLGGCLGQPTRFVPPRTPLPHEEFIITRDIGATWNALVRALDADNGITVASTDIQRRKVVLAPETVDIPTYCDCGRMGQVPLSGQAHRKGVITVARTAPQETQVRIRIDYWTVYHWKNDEGGVVRAETIPCVSNGRFEHQLHKRVRSYLAP